MDERLKNPEECIRLTAMDEAWRKGAPLDPAILEALLSCGSLSSAMRAAPMHAAWHPKCVENFILGKLDETGTEYKTSHVPEIGLSQIFCNDPSGIGVELNFLNEPL